MAGLTPGGLVTKRLDDVKNDILAGFRSAFGGDIKDGPKSVFGILAAVIARPIAEVWSALQAVYDSLDPDAATGAPLRNLAALVGVFWKSGVQPLGQLELHGDNGTTIPAGKVVRADSGREYILDEAVTIGVSGVALGWFRGLDYEHVSEPANTIQTIVTPVSGWDSVDNPSPFESGADPESDEDLRARRARSLSIGGTGTDGAIRAQLEALGFVQEARCISNRTMGVVDGQPPKSFQAVVWPIGLNPDQEEEIAGVVFQNMPAGIQSFGGEHFTVQDDTGRLQDVFFSYASEVRVHVKATVLYDSSTYAGDPAVAAATVEAGQKHAGVGLPVYVVDFVCDIAHVAGVRSVAVEVGLTGAWGEHTRLLLSPLEVATFDLSDVTVVSSAL